MYVILKIISFKTIFGVVLILRKRFCFLIKIHMKRTQSIHNKHLFNVNVKEIIMKY